MDQHTHHTKACIKPHTDLTRALAGMGSDMAPIPGFLREGMGKGMHPAQQSSSWHHEHPPLSGTALGSSKQPHTSPTPSSPSPPELLDSLFLPPFNLEIQNCHQFPLTQSEPFHTSKSLRLHSSFPKASTQEQLGLVQTAANKSNHLRSELWAAPITKERRWNPKELLHITSRVLCQLCLSPKSNKCSTLSPSAADKTQSCF